MKCYAIAVVAALLMFSVSVADDKKASVASDGQSASAQATGDSAAIDNSKPTSYWMEKKLDYSQAVLRGLASRDFESIRRNALQLRLLNKVEGFIRRRNPDYRTQVQMFERITAELARQAEHNNIEGVVLAFNQLAVSCVHCHEALRAQETLDLGTQE